MCVPWHLRAATLAELLVVLALATTLFALAAPSFATTRKSAEAAAAAHQLHLALHFARSSAIRRGVPTALCLSGDGRSCLERIEPPARYWLVFHDHVRGTGAVQVSGEDELLRRFEAAPAVEVRGTRTAVTYWPVSRAGTTSTFRVCLQAEPNSRRTVVVSQNGRPRATQDAVPCAR
jgi:type IV fimbrial biogenesis protein FimT